MILRYPWLLTKNEMVATSQLHIYDTTNTTKIRKIVSRNTPYQHIF